MFRSYDNLLAVLIGNTESQFGGINFTFVVCQLIGMSKAIIADHDNFLIKKTINVETKKCHSFPHTFHRTYLTAASITSYQSSDYPSAFHNHSSYDGSVPTRGARRGGEGGTKLFF